MVLWSVLVGDTGARTSFFPYSTVSLFLSFRLGVFRREQVHTSQVGDIDRYVGVPVIHLGRLIRGFPAAKLFKGGKEYSTLRNFRQDGPRQFKGEERRGSIAILMDFVCLPSALGPKGVRAIDGSALDNRVGRDIRRVAQAYRGRTSVAYAFRGGHYYLSGVFQSFLRNSASRRDRSLFLFVLQAEGIRGFLQRQVGHVVRNGAFPQVLVVLPSGHLPYRFECARGAVHVVRAILFHYMCNQISLST